MGICLPPYMNLHAAAEELYQLFDMDYFLRMAEHDELDLYWKCVGWDVSQVTIENWQVIEERKHSITERELILLSKEQVFFLMQHRFVSINHDPLHAANGKFLVFHHGAPPCIGEKISSAKLGAHEDVMSLKAQTIFILREDVIALRDGTKPTKAGKPKKSDEVENEPAAKSRNSYLKTIRALSTALIGTSTGEHYTDADLVLKALTKKGIQAPIKIDALAGYLRESKDI